MAKPREIYFTTTAFPRSVAYDMGRSTAEIFTEEQDWEFVEKAGYVRAIRALVEIAEARGTPENRTLRGIATFCLMDLGVL